MHSIMDQIVRKNASLKAIQLDITHVTILEIEDACQDGGAEIAQVSPTRCTVLLRKIHSYFDAISQFLCIFHGRTRINKKKP